MTMANDYLRVEACNLGNLIEDTNDLSTQFFGGRQKPRQRHQVDYTIRWRELPSVGYTAAAEDRFFPSTVDEYLQRVTRQNHCFRVVLCGRKF